MYTILFVDDDPLVLKKLSYILDWESLGFHIIGTASDGLEALEIMKTELPDVIISDINMPHMDGLSMIRELKQQDKQLHCILLTVNDQFGCAQQAINMGVNHYLLKPIEKNTLQHLMEDIREQLSDSHQHDLYVSDLRQKAMITESMIKDNFLCWISSGRQNLDEKQIEERFQFYEIPVSGKEFQIISIHINQLNNPLPSEMDYHTLLNTVVHCVENTLYDYHNYVIFRDHFYNLNILFGYQDQENIRLWNTPAICQSLRNDLIFTLHLETTICYSRTYRGYQNIYRCYYDTKYLSRYSPEIMDKGILSYESFMGMSLSKPIDFDGIRQKILKYLRANEQTKVHEFIETSLIGNKKSAGDYMYFYILRIDFIMTGILFLQENKLDIREVFHHHFEPLSEVMEIDDPQECVAFIYEFYQTLLAYVAKNNISSKQSMVKKCMELIDENISNTELSVKWLASQLYVNENYLSKQFHQELGLPLVRYISNTRLDTSKAYLDQGYSNLQSVAELCGFHDPLYFSKCFKKRFGTAPSKYIETQKHHLN